MPLKPKYLKQRAPTLLELNADPVKMCAWLGMTEEMLREKYIACNPVTYHAWGRGSSPTRDSLEFKNMTLGELLKWWVGRFKPEPRITSSYSRFMQECFSKGLGIKKGTIEERRRQAIALRPDLYSPPDPEVLKMHDKYRR